MQFTKVDPKEYVQRLMENGQKAKKFVKATPVMARKAKAGEVVVSMAIDKNSNRLVEETRNVAQEGDWVIKNKLGEVYINTNETFHRLYGASELEGKRMPIATPRTCIQIQDNISFMASWGEQQNIMKGGWLNIDNMDKIYGINPEEFAQTHVPYQPENTKL